MLTIETPKPNDHLQHAQQRQIGTYAHREALLAVWGSLARVEKENSAAAHFARKRPGWFTSRVFNPAVAGLTRLGISLFGSRVLEVTGRTSGEPRRTPVNLLTFEGERYLVAPRGNTQWARNLRVSGEGRLLVGSRSEHFAAVELADEEKPPVLRAYLKRWKFEVGVFFDGVGPDSSAEELRGAAPKHPVFRLL